MTNFEKTFRILGLVSLFSIIMFYTGHCQGHNPPQKIPAWYEFTGVTKDSVDALPLFIPPSYYYGPGDIYLNPDHTIHWITQSRNDTTFASGSTPYPQYTYDIRKYGATTGSSNNHSFIVAAVNAAHNAPGGGAVYIPPGTWKTAGFTLPTNVTLFGDGQRIDTLESIQSDTLLTSYNTVFGTAGKGNIWGITFYGNNVGQTGISLYGWYQFHVHDIDAIYFTGKNSYWHACQQGIVENCMFQYGAYGAYLDSGTVTTSGIYPNQVEFLSCHFWNNTVHGYHIDEIEYDAPLRNCDFINNGTSYNINTGSVFIGPSEFMGAMMDHCEWEEQVAGTRSVYLSGCLGGSPNITQHVMKDCWLTGNFHSVGVYVTAPTNTTKLTWINTMVANDSVDYSLGAGLPQVSMINSYYLTTDATAVLLAATTKNLSSQGSGIQTLNTIGSVPINSVTLKNGAGTGATYTLLPGSTAVGGSISITTGTLPNASDTVFQLNFYSGGISNGGFESVYSGNANASGLSTYTYDRYTAGSWGMKMGTGASLLASTTYVFIYSVITH
jgi:hypothetical protein